MNPVGVWARIGYAGVAFVAAGVATFHLAMWLLPRLAVRMHGADSDLNEYGIFKAAIVLGLEVGFTMALLGLTLPWRRRRRRSGRSGRVVISAVLVVLASISFASQRHEIIYDLLFAAWLSYALAFTYVRYGVRDRAKRLGSGAPDASAVGRMD